MAFNVRTIYTFVCTWTINLIGGTNRIMDKNISDFFYDSGTEEHCLKSYFMLCSKEQLKFISMRNNVKSTVRYRITISNLKNPCNTGYLSLTSVFT